MRWIALLMVLLVPVLFCCTKSTEPENSVPGTPENISPDDGATGQAINVDLWWTAAVDPDDDPVTYDVYLGTSSPPPLYASNLTIQRYYPGYLEYNTQYYWRIVAKDNHDHTAETNTWSFTTGQTPPTPLDFMLQADSQGDGIMLSWELMENIDVILLDIPDTAYIELAATAITYTDDTPTMTGTYSIYTVHGSDTSAPATANNTPYASPSDFTVDTTQGFGWNTGTGEGTVYFLDSTNLASIDIYVYVDTLLAQLCLNSGDHSPYNGDKSTGIIDMGPGDFFTAPSAGYDSSTSVVSGDYYAMKVSGATNTFFAKLYMVSADSSSITFNYKFQLINSLRIF